MLGAQGCGVRAIVRCIARAASAVSRQLCRNAATRGGTSVCRAGVAQWKAQRLPRLEGWRDDRPSPKNEPPPERLWRQGHERGPDTGGRFHPLTAAQGLSPGTAARRCPTTSASPRAPASRCSSPTSAARGSAPPTTIQAACRASISQGNRPVALEPVANTLNNRPRKVLGYKTPAEVLNKQLQSMRPTFHRSAGDRLQVVQSGDRQRPDCSYNA